VSGYSWRGARKIIILLPFHGQRRGRWCNWKMGAKVVRVIGK
jgi:hypothetical protein